MADKKTPETAAAQEEKRKRLEPWRPAFDKILFAIRRVQKLEEGDSTSR